MTINFYNFHDVIILSVLLFYSFFLGSIFEKRRKFALRVIGTSLTSLLIAFSLSFIDFHLPGYWSIIEGTLIYLIIQTLAIICLCVSYEISLATGIFITIIAYTYRHFLYLISIMILHSFTVFDVVKNNRLLFEYLIYLVIHILFAPAILGIFFYLRKKKDFNLSTAKIVFSSVFGSIVNVIFNFFVMFTPSLYQNPIYYVSRIFNCLICLLILVLLFSFLNIKELNEEVDIINKLRSKEHEQLKINKENIELINIKCHDLRHQLRDLTEAYKDIDKTQVESLAKAINIYDNKTKTGNPTLDIVLQEKSLICRNRNIFIESMVDGSIINFISEGDLYSLFGNILDNAIESASKIENEFKRIITLKVKSVGGGYLSTKKIRLSVI